MVVFVVVVFVVVVGAGVVVFGSVTTGKSPLLSVLSVLSSMITTVSSS